MAKSTLNQKTFESLIKHLVEIEEKKNKLVEQYFPEMSKERSEFVKLIENYIQTVDRFLRSAAKNQTGGQVPFVTIGSEVEVEELDTGQTSAFRIVHPFTSDISERDVSYIAPMGKALLLKKVGDEVEVKAPDGVFRYKVKAIRLEKG
ncbi:MAG: GreA/GreB family elongation factor [Moorella humiferrea]|nr:GreA/GreB family elongation factor [Moorella humiferrea]